MYSSYLRTKYSYMILTYNRLNFKQKHTNEGKKSDPTDTDPCELNSQFSGNS